ncbi:hypothetical protein HaLaN_16944 [Haematococcus lacustris]|uniref:Uncharacterized protein n=1 Tax=Haematococcus lacustris TaxID=44745 RepID=A0A699ZVF4_HAELA|nr:hypothetical protein HaLaN_16944 [Haematococcus lacustris]
MTPVRAGPRHRLCRLQEPLPCRSKKAVDTCVPEVPSSPSPTAPTATCSIEASSLSTTDSPHPDQCHEPTLAARVAGCAAGEAGTAEAAGQLLDCGPEPLERLAGVPKISQPSAVKRCAGAVPVLKGSAVDVHLRHPMDVQALLKQCVSPAHGFFGKYFECKRSTSGAAGRPASRPGAAQPSSHGHPGGRQ